MRGSQPWLSNRARVLRDTQTSAEERLWSHLRNRQLGGFKFVRQLPIGQAFADFACRDRKLVVEVDGGTHSTAAELSHDARRSEMLAQRGYRVFRVHNTDVYENIDGVLDAILAELEPST
ncbi:MAG TPA: DUF559 domain-containing protein [Hyphomicrobiaceae bacterium]